MPNKSELMYRSGVMKSEFNAQCAQTDGLMRQIPSNHGMLDQKRCFRLAKITKPWWNYPQKSLQVVGAITKSLFPLLSLVKAQSAQRSWFSHRSAPQTNRFSLVFVSLNIAYIRLTLTSNILWIVHKFTYTGHGIMHAVQAKGQYVNDVSKILRALYPLLISAFRS